MNHLLGIVGAPGTGKSSYLAKLIEAHRHPRVRVWVAPPYDAVRGVNVGTLEDAASRPTLPPVCRFDDDPDRIVAAALDVHKVTLVIDEAQCWAPRTYRLERDGEDSPLKTLAHRGRHHEVFAVWTSQRPTAVHVALRSNTQAYIFFRLSTPSELHWVTELTGDRQVAAAVADLSGYRAILWIAGRGYFAAPGTERNAS